MKLGCQTFNKMQPLILPPGIWKYFFRPILKFLFPGLYKNLVGNTFKAFEAYVWEDNPLFDVSETEKALEGSGIEIPTVESFLVNSLEFARDSKFGTRKID